MTCPFAEDQIVQLEAFVAVCKSQPDLLNHPKLAFFKDYIKSLGGAIPTATFKPKDFAASGDKNNVNDNTSESSEEEESDMESDIELDNEGVIPGDGLDACQVMGDLDKEPSEEENDQSDEKRSAAMQLFSQQKYDEAIQLYNEAIILNPTSALLFAKRGQAYLKLEKPNACIKDCTRALELNCDSAAAYKFRGRAHRLLGNWEEAAHDLRESCKIDYDEQANEWLAEVAPNADKLRVHRLNKLRNKEEREHRAKLRRARKAAAAHAAASAAAGGGCAREKAEKTEASPSADDLGNFAKLFRDPEIAAALQDPEVAAALMDVSQNPANILKYQSNPKIAAIFKKVQENFGQDLGGARMPAGFGGFPGATPTPTPSAPKPDDDDVGLD